MKNKKLSKKISLSLTVLLVIGLGIIFGVTYLNLRNVMTDGAIARLKESVQTRSQYIENYVSDSERYLQTYAQSAEVREYLMDQSESKWEKAQAHLQRYAKTNENLENIYIADMNSLTLCSMVEKTIGVQLRKDESLSTLISQVFADHTDKVLNLGVILSPSTQSQVLSMYCPIYDNDGNPIGFVGMALCAEQLLTELNELEFVGLTDCNNIILDVQKGNYIISRAKEKYGQAIDDENYLTLVEQIKKDQSYDLLDTSYKDVDTSKNKIAVYRYLPDRDWIVLVEVSETSLFASINQLVSILLVACAIILIICVISVFVITDTELRGVTHVAAAINEVAGLNISDHPAISRNLKRQDEVGILANAAQKL